MLGKRIRQFIKLHAYLLPFWDKQVLLFFCALGFLSFGILTPYLSRLVIDYGILRGDSVVFKTFLLCSAILFVFSTLIGIIQKYISFYVVLKLGFNIRMDFYKTLCKKPLAFFEKKTTGELLYRISADTKGVISLITGTVPNLLLTLIKLCAISVLCIWLNWKATLMVCAVMPLFYFLNHYFGTKSFHLNKELNEKGQDISKTLQDTLSHIKLYKSFHNEHKGLKDYKRQAIQQIGILIRNFWLGIATTQSHQLLNNGFGLLLTLYLGLQVLRGTMTLGSFVALSIYLVQLAGILKSLGGTYQGLISQFIYVDRFFEIYDQPEKAAAGYGDASPAQAPEDAGSVAFQNVSFGYSPGKPILHNLTVTFYPGETIALLGISGSGKSTLAKLITGLCVPTSGRIIINGCDISLLEKSEIRSHIGIVLQETPLLNKTIRENLSFGRHNVSTQEFHNVARIAGVDDFVAGRESGYESLVGERGWSLSQGQQQRIAIAMALMKKPAILILDEATNQLEHEMEERIIRNIRAYSPHTTLIMISCRKNTLHRADRIFELHHGSLKKRAPDSLSAAHGCQPGWTATL